MGSIWDKQEQLQAALEREATLRTFAAYVQTFKGSNPDDWHHAVAIIEEFAEMAEAALNWNAGDPLPPELPEVSHA